MRARNLGALLRLALAGRPGGQVDVGKSRVIVTHDTRDNSTGAKQKVTDAATTFEVEYRLNSKAKVWVGFTASDYDTSPNTEDDGGLRLVCVTTSKSWHWAGVSRPSFDSGLPFGPTEVRHRFF